MAPKTLTTNDLAQFTGSEHWYQHGLVRSTTYTDGAKYVADAGGAYWLLDEIALAQKFDRAVRAEPFQVWNLAVSDTKGVLTCDDGNGNLHEADPLHGFSPARDQVLFHRQRDPAAQRVLSQRLISNDPPTGLNDILGAAKIFGASSTNLSPFVPPDSPMTQKCSQRRGA